MDLSKDLTIVIPFRADTDERIRNINMVIKQLEPVGCKIIVLEADDTRKLKQENLSLNSIELLYQKDSNPIFHRTKYINVLLRLANSKLVGIWDSDVLLPFSQVKEACDKIVNNGFVIAYPYDGTFIELSPEISQKVCSFEIGIEDLENNLLLKPILCRRSCGGAFIVDREKYLEVGGENEHFQGWGPEDAERLHRCKILEYKVGWISKGKLYHLHHLRKNNLDSDRDLTIMREELIKVCSMSQKSLKQYLGLC